MIEKIVLGFVFLTKLLIFENLETNLSLEKFHYQDPHLFPFNTKAYHPPWGGPSL